MRWARERGRAVTPSTERLETVVGAAEAGEPPKPTSHLYLAGVPSAGRPLWSGAAPDHGEPRLSDAAAGKSGRIKNDEKKKRNASRSSWRASVYCLDGPGVVGHAGRSR